MTDAELNTTPQDAAEQGGVFVSLADVATKATEAVDAYNAALVTEPVVEKLAGPSVDPTLRKQVEAIVRDTFNSFMKGLGRAEPEPLTSSFKTVGNQWFATWSNNFKDRENETFTAKSIDDYIDRVDAGLVPMPELWFWHLGKDFRIGQADMVGRHGHFAVAMGTWDDTPKGSAARKYFSKHAKDTSLSHGFTYNPNTFKDGVYHDFNTFEISLLPRGAEANRFTTLQGVKDMAEKQMSEHKREEITKVFGKEALAELDNAGKALEDIEVEFKDFGHVNTDPPTTVTDSKAVTEVMADLIGGQGELSGALLQLGKAFKAEKDARAADAAQYAKDLKALRDELAPIVAAYADRPRSASDSKDTELTPERVAAITEATKEQATTIHPIWRTHVTQEGM